ncbi:helicase associated domain-containing protein [Streptomyces sp. LN699]|uniref:helicase associated domain-containing protein n=1 Tax=Streptomyces sp. LN699 TaxID=3112981 RepID=UPI0037231226
MAGGARLADIVPGVTRHGEDVGRWLTTQRRDWGRLNKEQQRRLGELGMKKAAPARTAPAKTAETSGVDTGGRAFQKGVEALAQCVERRQRRQPRSRRPGRKGRRRRHLRRQVLRRRRGRRGGWRGRLRRPRRLLQAQLRRRPELQAPATKAATAIAATPEPPAPPATTELSSSPGPQPSGTRCGTAPRRRPHGPAPPSRSGPTGDRACPAEVAGDIGSAYSVKVTCATQSWVAHDQGSVSQDNRQAGGARAGDGQGAALPGGGPFDVPGGGDRVPAAVALVRVSM